MVFNDRPTTVIIKATAHKHSDQDARQVSHMVTIDDVLGVTGHGASLTEARMCAAEELVACAAHQRGLMRVVQNENGALWVVAPDGTNGSRSVRIVLDDGVARISASSRQRNTPDEEVSALLVNHPGARRL